MSFHFILNNIQYATLDNSPNYLCFTLNKLHTQHCFIKICFSNAFFQHALSSLSSSNHHKQDSALSCKAEREMDSHKLSSALNAFAF